MFKTIEVLRNGASLEVQPLADEALNAILGGEMKCAKGYEERKDGTIRCACNYSGPAPKKEEELKPEPTNPGTSGNLINP